MNFKTILVPLTTIIVSAAPVFAVVDSDENTIVRVGDTAPHFVGNNTAGNPVDLNGYKGKVVVLDFFTTW